MTQYSRHFILHNRLHHQVYTAQRQTFEVSTLLILTLAGGPVGAGKGAGLGGVTGPDCPACPKGEGCCP